MTQMTRRKRPGSLVRFSQTAVGKKVLMALSGLILFGYVIVHVLGNLQVFTGAEDLNAYGAFLREFPSLLWGVRIILLLAVTVHIITAIQLARLRARARPERYAYRRREVQASLPSLIMFWSGIGLLVFIVYHLLHLTFGTVHPQFIEGDIYFNLVRGLQSIPVSAFYIVSMLFLGLHLIHGIWSMSQSLGVSHPRYSRGIQVFSVIATVLIVLGFISIPLSVLLGLVRLKAW